MKRKSSRNRKNFRKKKDNPSNQHPHMVLVFFILLSIVWRSRLRSCSRYLIQYFSKINSNLFWLNPSFLYFCRVISLISLKRRTPRRVPWAQGGGIFLSVINSISYLFRESWNVGNFNDVLLWISQRMPVHMARAWLNLCNTGTFLRPHDSREEP